MRTRVTAMAGASLFATTGLLGAYVGYPGLRRAAAATTCTVTTNADAGADTLRDCLDRINTAGVDTITFDPLPGPITLTADLPTVTRSTSVTITGAGRTDTIIDGGGSYRGFRFTGTGDVSFSNLTIKNAFTLSAPGGSAIYNQAGDITIVDSTLTNNYSKYQAGGAIYSKAGDITITRSTLTGNKGARGGAIFNYNGATTITSSRFEYNTANAEGGAVYTDFGATTITSSYFENNTANAEGGAIRTDFGAIAIEYSTFDTNRVLVNGYGGAISQDRGGIEINRSRFENNTASGAGAVYTDRGNITIEYSTFDTNRATDEVAGAVESGGTTTITGSTFKDNSADKEGGAVVSPDDVSIRDSTFYGNVAGSGFSGGAVSVRYLGSSERVDVVNSTFTGNTADAGSALYVYGIGTLSVNFSTVTGNTARTAGGAAIEAKDLYALDFVITNSILFGNLDSGSTPLDVETNGNLDLAFSLLTTPTSFSPRTTPPPSTLLFGDPLLGALADNGGDTQTMLPSADSPVIGMANPTGAPATDQRGFTRTTNGLADMGSVERGGSTPEPDLSQMPPSWFQAQQRREQSATCPPGMVPSWAQWPNEGTGGWTCEWTTWWDVHKGSTGGWVTTPGFNPGLRRPE